MKRAGRVLGSLSGAKMRSRPDWQMPKERNKEKKDAWRIHFMTWNCDRLDEKQIADRNRIDSDPDVQEAARAWIEQRARLFATDTAAIEAALHDNNFEPLLNRHPGFAKLLKAKGGRGKYPRSITTSATARWAADCLRKGIWPEHYGKKIRREEDGLTAEEIAAHWLLSGYGERGCRRHGRGTEGRRN